MKEKKRGAFYIFLLQAAFSHHHGLNLRPCHSGTELFTTMLYEERTLSVGVNESNASNYVPIVNGELIY